MKYKALATFQHDELGSIKEGDSVEATASQAVTPLLFGLFEEAKPAPAAKPAEPASKAKK